MRCESCGGDVPLQAIAPKDHETVRICASCVAIMHKKRIRRILGAMGYTALYGGAGTHSFVYARCQETMARRCLGTVEGIALMSEAELCALVRARFALVVVK